MYPVLFQIGRVQFHAYGMLLAISFLIGIFWSMRRAKRRKIEQNAILDGGLYVIVSAIVGSRLFYVLTHLDEFRGRWIDTFSPIQSSGEIGIGGLSMLGGVVLAILTLAIFCWKRKIPVLRFFDTVAPPLALGMGLTRIGCFLNGCCFGKACPLPWGLVFPDESPAGAIFPETRIHPTQLYSSLFDFFLMGALLLLDRKKRPEGRLASTFFILYGTFRIFIDFVRYYETVVQFRFLGQAFTYNQLISFVMVVFGIGLWFAVRNKARV